MADELDTAAQAAQGTPPAEGSESSQTESQVQTQGEAEETQPNATTDNQNDGEGKTSSGDNGNQAGQEAKPSRVERRIHDLLSKVKESGKPQTQQAPVNNGQQPYFTKEEIEAGEVDPKALAERFDKSVDARVQRAIEMDRITRQYESVVREHQADLEGIKDIDPELEAEAAAEYERINYQINPFSGKREFVPAVKFSEIVSRIKSRAEKLATKMAEKMAAGEKQFIDEVSSSQVVPANGAINGATSVKADTTNFSDFEKAYSRKK